MSDQSRRKLLKSIAAGSGVILAGKSLPESWARPVVESVMLPAHAMTSGQSIYSSSNVTRASLDPQSDSKLARLMTDLVSEARAGTFASSISGCATIVGSMLEFEILDQENEGGRRYSGMLPLDKQPVCVDYDYCVGRSGILMKILNISPDEVVIQVDGHTQYTIPEAQACIDVPNLRCL